MRDIYHAIAGESDHLRKLSKDALTDYRNSCGDASMGIVSALTALGTLSMDAVESEDYSEQDCRSDMRRLSCALRHLPRLLQALEQNRENADFELKRREATK